MTPILALKPTLAAVFITAALLMPKAGPAQAQVTSPPAEPRIKWSEDLGAKSRVLSLVDLQLCYRAPCPGDIFADAEGNRFGVVRIDFGVEDSSKVYNKLFRKLLRCGVQLRGTFRRGSMLDDQPLIDLVVEEIIDGPDPACNPE